jgi:hypothetical protein
LARIYRKVYDHRSAALHDATSSPLTMCTEFAPVPTEDGQGTCPSEIPAFGSAATAPSGAWFPKDTPNSLRVFDHIARGAINNWWDSMATDDGPGGSV